MTQTANQPQPITVADVARAFGPLSARLAEQGQWPDEAIVRKRLSILEEHGEAKGQRIIRAGQRYEARARADQYRRSFVH